MKKGEFNHELSALYSRYSIWIQEPLLNNNAPGIDHAARQQLIECVKQIKALRDRI